MYIYIYMFVRELFLFCVSRGPGSTSLKRNGRGAFYAKHEGPCLYKTRFATLLLYGMK